MAQGPCLNSLYTPIENQGLGVEDFHMINLQKKNLIEMDFFIQLAIKLKINLNKLINLEIWIEI